ncbi:SAM domain-containing protein SAMSN-1-like isoform X3 [Carassius carassius]|uniref:SAM domain-containing protein SAMSN-1-like isoform X3 n=1 Tax=Carassius carassius TaxID=217509 RepID=UPI00286884D5|nr:SAM domain-containing protein SAMSN-1-like isoform X3 [Carassius carassius]
MRPCRNPVRLRCTPSRTGPAAQLFSQITPPNGEARGVPSPWKFHKPTQTTLEKRNKDNTVCTNSLWPIAKMEEDLVLLGNNQNEDMVRDIRRAESQTMADRKIISRDIQQEIPVQPETVIAEMTHLRGTRMKKVGRKSSKRGTPTQETTAHISGAKGMMCDTGPQSDNRENAMGSRVTETAQARHRWSNPNETALNWIPAYNNCLPLCNEYQEHICDCATSRIQGQGDKINVQHTKKDSLPKGVLCSSTSVDFCASNRSTSFGRFDTFRNQHSPSKLEENEAPEAEGESTAENGEKAGSLGKKMKAISMTMRKRMAKKHVKSFSEDMGDDIEGETEKGSPAEKSSDHTSNSLESLYSGQSSSSSGGVASNSDVSSNRNSLKLEEEVPYTGQFCGRAKVHTDFLPSPYDTDSLKLKLGDIINIISKPPMGIWTGMLNNKVGNFKFIYVDVLPEKEKEEEEEAPKIRPVKVCKKPRPNTLLELLERLHLEEYASSLLINGYQTVDDLKHLKESHLIELNVTNPEHRRRLLAASDCLYVTSKDEEGEMKVDEEEDEDNDCPRDSGCFIPAECPDS